RVARTWRALVNDSRNIRHRLAYFEQLVDLLLVFDDREADIGVAEYEGHFGSHGVLVHRHRGPAEALRRDYCEREPRRFFTNDRQMIAAAEAGLMQAGRELLDLVGRLRPAPFLPDAEILFADGRCGGPLPCVRRQQTRECVSEDRLRHDRFVSALLFRRLERTRVPRSLTQRHPMVAPCPGQPNALHQTDAATDVDPLR